MDTESRQRRVKYNSYIPGEDDSVTGVEIPLQEKRTRFSLSHDQDSIGKLKIDTVLICYNTNTLLPCYNADVGGPWV